MTSPSRCCCLKSRRLHTVRCRAGRRCVRPFRVGAALGSAPQGKKPSKRGNRAHTVLSINFHARLGVGNRCEIVISRQVANGIENSICQYWVASGAGFKSQKRPETLSRFRSTRRMPFKLQPLELCPKMPMFMALYEPYLWPKVQSSGEIGPAENVFARGSGCGSAEVDPANGS